MIYASAYDVMCDMTGIILAGGPYASKFDANNAAINAGWQKVGDIYICDTVVATYQAIVTQLKLQNAANQKTPPIQINPSKIGG